MKILLLANHLNPGGIATYTISLAQGLKNKGHLIKVASRGGEWCRRLEELGIEHIYLSLHTKSELSPRIFFAKRELLKRLETDRVDILHAQTRITRVLAQFMRNHSGIPFVSTAHGFYTRRLGQRFFPCWGDGVVAISQAVKNDLVDKFKLDKRKIKVIYNGIDVYRSNKIITDQDKAQIKEDLGIDSEKVVVSISRLSFIKGQIYLVRAMEKIARDYPGLSCIIVGEGEAEDSLRKETDNLNLGKRVRFLKSVEDTTKILSIADVFVLPTMQEGLGLAILEAMASGIPVISTNIGGIPEIIRDGTNGLLVPAQDASALAGAISRLLKDEPLRIRLALNGRETVREKFSAERMIGESENFYEEIIAERFHTR